MTLRIGVVGCGNISDIYFKNSKLFNGFEMVAAADLRMEAANAKAAAYGVKAMTVADLIGSDEVDLVLNLTVPAAHADVALAAIAAGKHVYGEKPLAITLADGQRIVEAAHAKGVYVGSAPDTVFGPGVQVARKMFDDGLIGDIVTGTACVLSRGMEHWHPNPEFFFKFGGGPVLDLGPYYLAALVSLLGPVKRIQATGKIGLPERIVMAEGPQKGQSIKVETLTTVNALLSFESGADVVLIHSWDVWAHGQIPLELHGVNASIRVPDPNFFGGQIQVSTGRNEWKLVETNTETFGIPNHPADKPVHANYRGLGLADMAAAIRDGRPNRTNGDFALHCLSVMLGIVEAASSGQAVNVAFGCERPAALGAAEALSFII